MSASAVLLLVDRTGGFLMVLGFWYFFYFDWRGWWWWDGDLFIVRPLELFWIYSEFLEIFLLPFSFLFFFPFSDIVVEGLTVLSDGEFFIVVHADVDWFFADYLLFLVMEIFDVRMSEGLLRRQPGQWTKSQQPSNEINSFLTSPWEKRMKPLLLQRIDSRQNIIRQR